MPSFNRTFLLGNLTRDPEIKSLPSGDSLVNFNIAVNESYLTRDGERKEKTTFVGIVAYGKQAEVIAKYMRKGKPIFIEGSLAQDSWEDNSGQKKTKTYVKLRSFQFIDSNGGDSQQQRSTPSTQTSSSPSATSSSNALEKIPNRNTQSTTRSQGNFNLNDDVLDEDVPF